VVGNHTQHHYLRPDYGKGFKDLGAAMRTSELTLAQAALDRVLGHAYPMKLMRPPGGSGGFGEKDSVVPEMARQGLWTCMWTVDSNNDEKGLVNSGDDYFLGKVTKFLETDEHGGNGAIILIHPTTLTIGGMKEMIRLVTSKGLSPTTIPGLYGA
jgi:peptidoglycan/xylan/chitin deacetylase (PgdA/CDA1 family)